LVEINLNWKPQGYRNPSWMNPRVTVQAGGLLSSITRELKETGWELSLNLKGVFGVISK